MTEQKINPEQGLKTAVALALEGLSDDELGAFYNNATWGDGETRSRVEKEEWFPKIQSFFSEKGGREIHPAALEAIGSVVVKRG